MLLLALLHHHRDCQCFCFFFFGGGGGGGGGGVLEIDFAICATNKSASELQYIRAYETEVPSTSYLRDRKIRRNDLHYTENMVHFKSRNASAI